MAGLRRATLVRRNLTYFWRTNLAVAGAVTIAVGVLTGALLVGDSVRGSLRTLFVARLGSTDHVVLSNGFFREKLSEELVSGSELSSAPLVAIEGMVTNERTGSRRAGVQVYGVDERFWSFHDASDPGLSGRDVLLTPSLSEELGAEAGDAVLLRVERPSDVARGSLHGQKEDVGRTIRLSARGGIEETGLPEFSFYPSQESVSAVFVPLTRLQRDLEQEDRVNAVLVAARGTGEAEILDRLRRSVSLEDLTVQLQSVAPATLVVTSSALLMSKPIVEAVEAAADEFGFRKTSVFTYLANSMRVGERELPYSLVAALDEETYRREILQGGTPSPGSIVLNDWAGEDLGARPGERLEMDFYLWEDEGRIETRSAAFTVDAIVPMKGLAADRRLAPDYPGISDTANLSDWEPPFPIDLRRVRDKDEDYWDGFRATPKAFLPLARAQELWPVRQGKITSIRLSPHEEGGDFGPAASAELRRAWPEPGGRRPALGGFTDSLRAKLDPLELGFSVVAVRDEGLEASSGATDFGEYFVYFSYFLVMAALLLTGLFFKLGVEQRQREVGTLLATGFAPNQVRGIFLAEALVLAVTGALAGVLVALGYASLILYGLRTWWVDAVGTRLLTLHVSGISLVAGVAGGVAAALVATGLSLRFLAKVPARGLLAGDLEAGKRTSGGTKTRRGAIVARLGTLALAVGLVLLAGVFAGLVSEALGFFGAGNLALVSLLAFQWAWLETGGNRSVSGNGLVAMARLGFRSASARPGRSLVAIALIAFATFTVVAVDAFRKDDSEAAALESGSGGFPLVAESLLPLHWDPNSEEGRDAFNLPRASDAGAVDMRIQTFRLRPGDDASCLNLYRPQNPRVLAPTGDFLEGGGFRFSDSLAESPEEKNNPWLLLERHFPDGAIPVIGDASSMTYVLHLGLGEDFLLPRAGETPVRLRLVATLRDSIFQSELLMEEERFLELFPEVSGFRFFLVDVPRDRLEAASTLLEERLRDYGLDARSSAEKLAGFHRVENTYLSTFQSLGGLGLVLGTLGLAAVLLRNLLERRREIALLRAVGYKRRDLTLAILAENALLLIFGLVAGALSAFIAIAPAFVARGGSLGSANVLLLLGAVLAAGVVTSLVAVGSALRSPLLAALRAE